MIRVVYKWRVPKENFAEFQQTWTKTTNNIHETVAGALGSFMLRSFDSEDEVITVAKWDSVESWKAFWGSADPAEMQEMRKLGTRISANAYEEIDDFTR